MGFSKKLSSALGSLQDRKPEESSALDSIRKLKEELGMPQSRKDKDDEGWVEKMISEHGINL